MQSIGVVTDSNSGIGAEEAAKLGIRILPMPFYMDDTCYYENVSITRDTFFAYLDSGRKIATSQPSPEDVMHLWREALKEYETLVYIPMSSGLSGSCGTAQMLANEDEFAGRVFVVDNGRVSTPMHQSVLDAIELIANGHSAAEIKEILEKNKENMIIYVAVETLEHLKNGGRISKTTAALGSILNIKPVLKFDIGILDTYKKCRGMIKARKEMLLAMKETLETRFAEQLKKGEVHLLAASSADEETTASWVKEIEAFFPDLPVVCDPLPMVLACHIGAGGLGIGCSCKPV